MCTTQRPSIDSLSQVFLTASVSRAGVVVYLRKKFRMILGIAKPYNLIALTITRLCDLYFRSGEDRFLMDK